jgi:polyhydroxyalkanoate synthase
MNPIIAHIDILSKLYQSYITNINIMSKYQYLYNTAFQQALKIIYKDDKNKNFNEFDIHHLSLYEEIYQNWLKNSDNQLDILLKSKEFITLLSNHLSLHIDIHKALKNMGYPTHYFDTLFEKYVRKMYLASAVQKDFNLTPFDIEYINGNIRLIHYRNENEYKNINDINNKNKNKKDLTPLLIIYAQINRFHIMDIHPSRSVVKSLLSKGLDIYLLDWGYPTSKDNNISLNDYIRYVKEAVEYIYEKNKADKKKEDDTKINGATPKLNSKEESNNIIVNSSIVNYNRAIAIEEEIEFKNVNEVDSKNKISIIGYCWGGIIALIFTALYSKYIKNLTLMAAPVDFSKDKTILSTWAKDIDVDELVEEFAHLDGQILDIGFVMRNPVRYIFDKYITMMKKYNDKEFIDMFVAVEKWLYDTPIIPEKFFKQIINECYKNNLLIKNEMKVNGNMINLKNIHTPLLTIVAEKDDLVSPESTLEVNNCVSSKEKKTIKAPGGHVALCISKMAHESMWPQVAEWILSKS